jgi:hypothetical protein
MPEIACPSCNTSYDTSGFEPGQRFRCHGDGCTERLTVPEAGAPMPSRSETPTPAPVAAAAAPVADYAADDDILEENDSGGDDGGSGSGGGGRKRKRRRGGSRRGAAAPPPPPDPRDERRARANVPPPKSQAPMYAALGGVGLLVVVLGIVMLSAPVEPKGGKKAKPKPRFKKSDPVDFQKGSSGSNDGDDETPVAVEEKEKPKPVKRPRKNKDAWRFVADAGFKPTFDKYVKQMFHDDPNIAQEGADALYDKGSKDQLVNTILNHLPTMDFTKLEERTVASMLMDIVADALGDDAKVGVGDDVVVTPNMNGKLGYVDAMRAWRNYWRDHGGKVAGE